MSTLHWTGGAPATTDVWTLTVANTWATNDIANVDFGVYRLQLTIGSAVTTADVAGEIVNMINATSATAGPAPGAGYVRNFGGQEVLPFQEMTAELVGSTVVITATRSGNPLPITCSETTAGSGTLTAAHTVSATGPTFADNADNWAEGTLPVDNDTVVFDRGNVSITDGLTYFKTGNIDLNWTFTNDWTGTAGRPAINSRGYAEQRTRYLQCRGGSKTLSIVAGAAGNLSGGNLWLDLTGQNFTNIDILAARNGNLGQPSVFLAGANTAHTFVTILAGNVSIEPTDAPTPAGEGFVGSSFAIGQPNGQGANPTVTFGSAARLVTAVDVLHQYGGAIIVEASPYTDGTHYTEFRIHGGKTSFRAAGGVPPLTIERGGTVALDGTFNSGGFVLGDDIFVYGGTLDLAAALAITQGGNKIRLHPGSTFRCPSYVAIDDVDLVGCALSDLTIVLPPNRVLDLSAAAT